MTPDEPAATSLTDRAALMLRGMGWTQAAAEELAERVVTGRCRPEFHDWFFRRLERWEELGE